MYEHFADIYDEFMQDASYPEWADYIVRLFGKFGASPKLILDLACGTGSLTAELAKRGYEMIAVDGSPSMLEQAREKIAQASGQTPLCLQQDMREFELYGTVDAVLCTCDSLNYLTEAEDLKTVFRLVENYLEPNGLFIFDLNTRYKFSEILSDHTFAETAEDAAFIWQNYFYEEEDINEYQLTFFEQDEDGRFERHEELHYEKAYDPKLVLRLLEEAGLEPVALFDAFTEEAPRPDSERICFVAREHLYSQLGKKRTLESLGDKNE